MEQAPATNRKTRSSVLRSALGMALWTFVSRIFGLVREQVRGYYVGTGMWADAFTMASTIPNLLRRLFAEGTMTGAFVPVMSGLKTKEDQARVNQFYSGFMTLFIMLVAAVTLLGIVFSGPIVKYVFAAGWAGDPQKVELTVRLTQVMFPYLFIISIAAIVQASLNTYKIFGPSAFTPVLLSICIIVAVVCFSKYFPNPAWALSVGFVVGGLFQLVFQIPFLRKTGIRFRPTLRGLKDPSVREVARLFLPGIIGISAYQINITVAQFIASGLVEGSVASLQYSLRLQELVLGIFAVSVSQVILTTMSEQVASMDWDGLKDTLEFSIGLLALITIPASVGLIILGEPVVRLLFQYGKFDAESTRMTAWALTWHSAGILFIGLQRNVNQVFNSMKDTKTPAIVAIVIMVINVVLCYALAGPMGNGGIAAAGSIAALVNVVILYVILRGRIGALDAGRIMGSLWKILLATAAMSVFLIALRSRGTFDVKSRPVLALYLCAAIGAAMVIYIAVARICRSPELAEFTVLIRRKLSRRRRSA